MLRLADFCYYPIRRRIIEQLQDDPCIVSDRVRGSNRAFPYTEHGMTVQGVDTKRLERNRKLIAKLQARNKVVDEYIDSLYDEELQLLLGFKYKEGMTWDQVSKIMGKTADGCRKQVFRYFDSIGVKF